jgi:hypothetical protein
MSFDQTDGLVQFLLDIKETIDELEHQWLGDKLNTKTGEWEKKLDPIMSDKARIKLISFLNSQLSRNTFFTYYEDGNDVINIIVTFCSSLGGVLACEFHKKEIFDGNIENISELYLMRDDIEAKVKNAYQQAVGGGTRNSIRQSARIIESNRKGAPEGTKKKFGWF